MKPREAYKQRVFLDEQSLRIIKAEKRLSMKGKADKVSAAIQAEGTASSKTIKVMILNAVTQAKEDERKNQKAKNTKRANENGEQKSKNLKRTPSGGTKTKKTTAKKTKLSQPSATKNGAGDKSNATPPESSKRNTNSTKKCEEKRKAYQEKEWQIIREIERDMLTRYGFVSDLEVSTFKSVCRIIGNIPCRHYFSRPNNLVFHDLTKNKSVPFAAK